MNNILINVGVAQVKASSTPTVLRTILGSCVGICIYDRMKKIGGLAHILLPNDQSSGATPEKYAETAIPLLVNQLIKDGAKKEFLSAKIAGGASMFKFESNIALGQIGDRNIEETKKMLNKLGVPLLEEDVGGNTGRVIDFFLEDGRLKVKASGNEKYYYKV
ncbi:MAG TPA: chemotaxis protein CheD [Spirochaetota bacterium]|nr:chemotaxis protein CheD [Spirochaetota bacterium]HRZ25968.1 chemotaxis protein CheD [Spirochaetota bacterium]HSA14254.1 chemotaxis protein CheD [Spirochaetota bacterium]